MNSLIQTYTLLTDRLLADSQCRLAYTVTLLDPLWQEDEDDWQVPHDEDGSLALALRVTRTAFPEVYVQAVNAVRRGASYAELDRLICHEITQRGIPLESLELIGFGVPMPAYGVVLDDPEFYAAQPDVLPVLACFGISPEPNRYQVDVPDAAYTAGRWIAEALQDHPDERYRQVAWLMQWLFSCSGNSSVDLSLDDLYSLQPLSWEADEVAFARDIIGEADEIMSASLAGLDLINGQPDLLAALEGNIQRIYKAIDRQQGKRDDPKVRLKWPDVCSSGQSQQLFSCIKVEQGRQPP